MVPYKYGEFEERQIQDAKTKIRKKIFFLLLIVDPETCEQFNEVNVEEAFNNVQNIIGGLNAILLYPREVVFATSLVEAALLEYKSQDFSYPRYRKLLLDAGWEITRVKEVP